MRAARALLDVRTRIAFTLFFTFLVGAVPLRADSYYTQGKLAFSARKYNDAMELFRKALQADPSNGNPLFYMGYILENTNKKEEAVQAFCQAVELRMDYDLRDKSYWKIIVYYKYTEDWDNLYTYASRFLQIRDSGDIRKLKELAENKRDPALKEVFKSMREADSKKKSGDLKDARRIYQGIVDDRPDYQPARWQLVLLDMKDKNYRSAERHLDDLVRRNPSSWEYQYKSGVCATILGNAERALRFFAEARRLNDEPDDSFKFFILLGEGLAHVEAGSYEEARQKLTDASKKKKTAALLGGLARAEFELKRTQPAIAHAAEALQVEADEADASAVKGLAALERGAEGDARTDLIRARKRLEKDGLFPRRFQRDLFILAHLYCDKDDWQSFASVNSALFGDRAPGTADIEKYSDASRRFIKGNATAARYSFCRGRTELSEHRYDAAVESLRGQTSADGQWHLLRAYAGVGNVLEVKQLGFKLAAERKDTWARLRSEPLVQKLMEKDAELRDWIKREGRDKEAPVDKPKQKPDAGSRSDGTRS